MTDECDRAGELEALANQGALQHQLSRHNFDTPSRTHCADCDDPIPKKRQALGGVTRCAECQGFEDHKAKQWAR